MVLLKLKYSNNWTRAILRNLFSLKPITNYYNKFKYLPPTGINFNLLSNIFQHFMNQLERAPPPTRSTSLFGCFPKIDAKWRPKWTSTHQLTMEAGGWIAYGQETNFWLYFHPLVMYWSSHASTYLVTAKCLSHLLTYILTTYIPYLLIYGILTHQLS